VVEELLRQAGHRILIIGEFVSNSGIGGYRGSPC
jgi:hypothetical protein